MIYRIAADLVLVVHLTFVVAVVAGGFAWLRWRLAPLVHLPIAGWGAYVELTGRGCPLTAWENGLLRAAGESGYGESFIAHYLLAALYPDGLTRSAQLVLAALVVLVNVCIYFWVWRRRRRAH
jgi:hypothetical protein